MAFEGIFAHLQTRNTERYCTVRKIYPTTGIAVESGMEYNKYSYHARPTMLISSAWGSGRQHGRGHRVLSVARLNNTAVPELFSELGLIFQATLYGSWLCFSRLSMSQYHGLQRL